MTKIARDYTAKAIAIVNAGSGIKSRIKEANEDLARAYAAQRQVIMNACLDVFHDMREAAVAEASIIDTPAHKLYWAMPDLHNFKPKHAAAIREVFAAAHDDVIAIIEELAALRAELKNVEVVKFERKEQSIEEKIKERAIKTFAEISAEKKAEFDWASAIIRELNAERPYEAGKGLLAPVSCRPVYCSNYAGTVWIRADFYFHGEKMALNMIMAAVEKIAREKEGK